ncbi:hypothetical protein GH714_017169 [Hevea brasiliensis]|uniref:ENTH domain-containing protein n=1 Tax=Hevea brasiliensis TaxID=3981 RepID=A0A6A6K5W0_HEVBR|nr:hypothetical protein GH714_017169 [Hevea brasiliensis]
MGLITNLRDLIGIIKDKASQSKAAIISKPKTLSLNLALLRATTHDPFAPPNPKHITTMLSYGYSSRATASAAIEALMDRLQSTHDSSVAIKCLAVVHHIIKDGFFSLEFMFNYLGNHRYARYLEHLLSTSRVLGFFLCSTSSTAEKDKEEEKVSALTNPDLLREIDSLTSLMEEICNRPDSLHMHGNELLEQIISLVGEDYLSSINEISIRVDEVNHRLSCLSFVDSVELVCVLKRLEDCKERLLALSSRKKALVESLWSLISEMKGKVGDGKAYKEEGRLLLTMGRKDAGSESARFGERALSYSDSVRFSSARFGLNEYALQVNVESVESCA